MKLNWQTLKITLAFVVVIGALFWAVDSVRTRSYAGTDLNFVIGQGPVTVTNPSDQPVPVQIVGGGTRSFSALSKVEGLAGTAVRAGSGNTTTYSLDFALIPGINEFTIVRGADVKFVANTSTRLDATVQPLDEGASRTTLFIAGIVILGALFYAFRTLGYSPMGLLRGQLTRIPEAKPPVVENAVANQGRPQRSYGDNRADPLQ